MLIRWPDHARPVAAAAIYLLDYLVRFCMEHRTKNHSSEPLGYDVPGPVSVHGIENATKPGAWAGCAGRHNACDTHPNKAPFACR
jgi:hypothetical protein